MRAAMLVRHRFMACKAWRWLGRMALGYWTKYSASKRSMTDARVII
jgi:hypothetical protein